jgi:formylmethanofuran dehydrogenase subunit E
MVMRAADRLQLTREAGDGSVKSLLAMLPDDIDLVLLETHSPESYPTVLAETAEPAEGEQVIGRWSFESLDQSAEQAAGRVRQLLPRDRELDHALRRAMALHGGHACAGIILGTRLALAGAHALGVDLPDRQKRLVVSVEIDRCAADAIQAVTGCRPGKRTLGFLDYGKLAATFVDLQQGAAVRVAALGDLRERVGGPADRHQRHEAQRAAYLAMPDEQLFSIAPADAAISQWDMPGPPRSRVNCATCGEEVSDGREVPTEVGPVCRGCLGGSAAGRYEGMQS